MQIHRLWSRPWLEVDPAAAPGPAAGAMPSGLNVDDGSLPAENACAEVEGMDVILDRDGTAPRFVHTK